MALPDKLIIFLGRTFSGHNHDSLMLKQELPPELEWFADINVRVDLGYLGMKSDYRGEQIAIPTRKPRKSQKHPNPQLSEEQKAANTALSRVRIFIEHAIGLTFRANDREKIRIEISSWDEPKDHSNPRTRRRYTGHHRAAQEDARGRIVGPPLPD
jgi:hypothetical protein